MSLLFQRMYVFIKKYVSAIDPIKFVEIFLEKRRRNQSATERAADFEAACLARAAKIGGDGENGVMS